MLARICYFIKYLVFSDGTFGVPFEGFMKALKELEGPVMNM